MPKKAKAKPEVKPTYKYEISDIEARYKIYANPDKYSELMPKIRENAGYCLNRTEKTEDNRCMCKQFRERDSEGFCKCRVYRKELRTEKQAEAFKNSTLNVNEKKEKDLVKELEKEEAAQLVDPDLEPETKRKKPSE